MPFIDVRQTRLWYEDSAPGDMDRDVVVFSHGLLWDSHHFHYQEAALKERYRVIRYDHRGQGRSEVPPGNSVPIETCYDDAVALIEALGLPPVHFVGLSMGGFVAMRLAARRPDLIQSCTLIETSADVEPNVMKYRLLNIIARWLGLGIVAGKVMRIMHGRTFMTDPDRADERLEWRRRLVANRRSIYKAVNGVIGRHAVLGELRRIKVPTLILVGDEDTATTPAKAEQMKAHILNSELKRIPKAGHSSCIENPDAINAALKYFLRRHRTDASAHTRQLRPE